VRPTQKLLDEVLLLLHAELLLLHASREAGHLIDGEGARREVRVRRLRRRRRADLLIEVQAPLLLTEKGLQGGGLKTLLTNKGLQGHEVGRSSTRARQLTKKSLNKGLHGRFGGSSSSLARRRRSRGTRCRRRVRLARQVEGRTTGCSMMRRRQDRRSTSAGA
jgi:hypothetical protein